MNSIFQRLNADCVCLTLDRPALERAFQQQVGPGVFDGSLSELRPTLVSNQTVFIAPEHAEFMRDVIDAIETIARHSSYRQAALQSAPEIAHFEPGPIGIFMSYDFHLGSDGPKLIEINTNAGGGYFNALVAQAQKACCNEVDRILPDRERNDDISHLFLSSFRQEWRRQKGDATLTTVAIVDGEPEGQYLYPEFVLFQRLFERHGIAAVIASPEALEYRDGRLWSGSLPIDLIYNRLTDFSLNEPTSAAIRSAYLAGAVVVTPNPWAHAIYADKRNLVRLTDEKQLAAWGVDAQQMATVLGGIARTELVTVARADELWAMRNELFFKPVAGFGGKAAYRGDKVTRRVWDTILSGNYIAQELIPPSNRTIVVDGRHEIMKVDFRNYTYAGEVQLLAARLYQGQTTNFRTPGGGFAPVTWARHAGTHALPDREANNGSCA